MELQPNKTKRIYETIVEQIKNLIVSGNLKPGDKLPSEKELAEILQVSRTSVREALCALDMVGILEVRPGGGAFVRQFNPHDILESLSFALILQKEKIRDIMEVRRGLEIEAAGLAAERATEENLAKMEEALRQMEADQAMGAPGDESDLKFHYGVVEAARNPLLLRVMNTIYDTMNQTLRITRNLWLTSSTPQRLLEEHRQIYQAIKSKNGRKARKIMSLHIQKVLKELERIYS